MTKNSPIEDFEWNETNKDNLKHINFDFIKKGFGFII